MKKGSITLLIFLLTLVFSFSLHIQAQVPEPESVPDELLVKFKDSVSEAKRAEIHARQQSILKNHLQNLNVDVVRVDQEKKHDTLKSYVKEADVEYVEPNYIARALELTNDPSLLNSAQWNMYKIKASDASSSAWTYSKSNSATKIAILDTGIDNYHEDLASKVVVERNCTSNPTNDDLYGHGTRVAGIASAVTNNGIGVAGVGYNASLMDVKVLDDTGSGAYSWIADCIVWAADNGAKVINLSLGGSGNSKTLQNAVNYAWNRGVILTAAAGNSGSQSPSYPAYYSNVIAVGATDQNDQKASWSNYGKWVDVAAPGVNIFSTLPSHINTIGIVDYGNLSGTSMATPHVAGLAALIWPTSLGGSNSNVRRQIEQTADKINGTGKYWTYGRINALSAVTKLPARNRNAH